MVLYLYWCACIDLMTTVRPASLFRNHSYQKTFLSLVGSCWSCKDVQLVLQAYKHNLQLWECTSTIKYSLLVPHRRSKQRSKTDHKNIQRFQKLQKMQKIKNHIFITSSNYHKIINIQWISTILVSMNTFKISTFVSTCLEPPTTFIK